MSKRIMAARVTMACTFEVPENVPRFVRDLHQLLDDYTDPNSASRRIDTEWVWMWAPGRDSDE